MARQQLAVLLNAARERSGRSLDELARFLDVSSPQASRLDSGVRGFRPDDVQRLAEWYGLPVGDHARLLALAAESRRRGWWQQIDLNGSYRTLIGLEQIASSIVEYNTSVVPGLLQTREYARIAASVGDAALVFGVEPAKIDLAASVRMRRQEILRQSTPPRLSVVIDEAVLARGPRDADVRKAQLESLHDSTYSTNITVQVMAFEQGLHPAASSQFILLGMGGVVPDLLYSQGLHGEIASSDADTLARYYVIWNELRTRALDESESRARINRYLRGA